MGDDLLPSCSHGTELVPWPLAFPRASSAGKRELKMEAIVFSYPNLRGDISSLLPDSVG